MNRSAFFLLLAIAPFALAPCAFAEEKGGPFATTVMPFLEAHCVECHGPDTQKAGLRLDTLATDLRDQRTMASWVHVHDKISAGEMPPKKRERPPQPELEAVTHALDKALHAASLELQEKKGRAVLRRLNGTEYENTIRELVGTRVEVKDLLPEDSSAGGFDNIAATLDFSATHLLQYQVAAEKAVVSAMPQHPPIPFSQQLTGKQMSERGPNFRQTLTRSCVLQGDALVIYSKLPRYGLCCSAHVPAAGRYKAQMSACAVGADAKPVTAAFLTVEQSGREDPVLRECRDIPPGKPAGIEFEFDLKKRQAFVVNLLSHWDIREFKKPIEVYKGPGILVEWIKIEGPLGQFPPPSYQRLFGNVPLKPRSVVSAASEKRPAPRINDKRTEQQWLADPLIPDSAQPKEDAERLIRAFLPRAFRRPVGEELQKHFVAQVHAKLDQKYSFADAMIYGYKAILTSPHFLLLLGPGSGDADLRSPRLDDYALAVRLSYFLWSAPPDDELLAVAAKGQLTKPEVLRAQVERLLQSPKAHGFTENFAGQWLDLRRINATIPDPRLYGEFDGMLLWSMPRETECFFEEVLRNDLSLLNFVDSDWTMLNERLAAHYGIAGVQGNDFRKVKLPPDSHRGGVLTQASVLKVTADGTRTSPVLRGKWVLERIIGKPPAPPPPDVPAIEPDIRGATTIRQQLDKHRAIASCASCHNQIDPPGFALETFDPIGGWRDYYRASVRTKAGGNVKGKFYFRGPNVETGGETAEGRKFASIEEFKKLLLEDKDQLARNLAQKLLVYATGADIQYADREVVEKLVAAVKTKTYSFRALIHEVVQSRAFLNK
jgi:mono/diheme cytochrome c family protein